MSKIKKEKLEKKIEVSLFRESPKVIKISKNNYYYLINREKYDIAKIMMMIKHSHLPILGEKFHSFPKGLEKIRFTNLLLYILKIGKMPPYELTDLIYGIYKLFKEIDFNEDNNMEWQELTQFMIDIVEGENNNIERGLNDNKSLSEKKLLKYKRYELSRTIKDLSIHKTKITSGIYLNKINKILISEYNNNSIKVYNPLIGELETTIDVHEINSKTQNLQFIEILNEVNIKKKYTVISFTVTEYIIAVVLSNKLIQFFRTFNYKDCELIFCLKAKSLQKRIWFLENHNMWLSSGDKEADDSYYFINELDIGFDMKTGYPVPFSNNLIYKNRYCKILKHRNEIYDVIEIKKPFLILSACLDGLIRLINVRDSQFIKIWKYHNLGVKHLDYNPNMERNGYILSTGFEYNINLYCTDLSLDNVFRGKLEGHFVPLIDCKFISYTPICVSVDEDGNIRIWETLLKVCLQNIPNSKRNITLNGILIMREINKFVIFGNNLSFYDSKYKEENDNFNESYEENHPIKICYNKYYQHFYVSTLNDIRIYNSQGKLDKIFKKIIDNGFFDAETKIRDFIFDNNHRKFYLGFSNGAIVQYNAGNGSIIKIINQIEYEKNSIIFYNYHHTKDISKIYFYSSKNDLGEKIYLLLSSSLDSTIQIYDERDYDYSKKLRMYKGAHTINERKCEILCMDYNFGISQLATGSDNGLITLWDFENMKIEDILYLNYKIWKIKLDVLYIKYLDNYPLLFSSYSEGICILWGVKTLSGEPILKFQNFYQTLYKIDLCDVSCCCFYDNVINDFDEKYLNKIYFVDEPEFIEERNKKRYDKASGELLPTLNIDVIPKDLITDKLLDPFHDNNNDDITYNSIDKEEYSENLNHNYYLLICDKKGFMKILNLKGVFNQYIHNIKNKYEKNSNFNILKKENVDYEQVIQSFLRNSKKRQNDIFKQPYHNLYSSRIINSEWKGHFDHITDVEFIDDPISTVTISKDNYLRIWNKRFELIGEINILSDENILVNKNIKENKIKWDFKVNEKKVLEKEVNEIVQIFENIDLKEEIKIIIGSKIDKDINNPEKYEIDEIQGLIKRRKKIEEKKDIKNPTIEIKANNKEHDIIINKNFKDENYFQSNYEAILLKNISNKIEKIIKNNPKNEGMGQISINLMDDIIENKNKINKSKTVKTFNSLLNDNAKSNSNSKNDSTNKRNESLPSSLLTIMQRTINNTQKKSNLLNNSINTEDEKLKSLKHISIKIDDNRKQFFDHLLFSLNNNEKKFISKVKTSLSDINIINMNENIEKDKIKKNNRFKNLRIINNINNTSKDYKNQTNKKFNKSSIGFNNKIFIKKNNSVHKLNYALNRNSLYSEKLFYKPFYKEKRKEKEENIFPDIHKSKIFNEKNKIPILKEKTGDKKFYHINASDLSDKRANLFKSRNKWKYNQLFNGSTQKEDKRNKDLNDFGYYKKLIKSQSLITLRNNKKFN